MRGYIDLYQSNAYSNPYRACVPFPCVVVVGTLLLQARQWLQKAITSYKTVSGTHKLSKKQRADFVDATARLAVLDDPDYMPPGCSVM